MTIIDLFNWQDGIGDIINVRVTARASANRIKVEHKEDGTQLIRVYVTAVPVNGQSNKEVIKLLAKELNLPQSAFTITHGQKVKNKTIRITRS